MPSKRKLHVGYGRLRVGATSRNQWWCKPTEWRDEKYILCDVLKWKLQYRSPPNLSADKRVCKRCVKAMEQEYALATKEPKATLDRAWKESQG
jgi:hypothetical protein